MFKFYINSLLGLYLNPMQLVVPLMRTLERQGYFLCCLTGYIIGDSIASLGVLKSIFLFVWTLYCENIFWTD